MTQTPQEMAILRRYAGGAELRLIANDLGVDREMVIEAVSAVGFQRARARELVRQQMVNAPTAPRLVAHRAPVRKRSTKPLSVIRWENPPPGREIKTVNRQSRLDPCAAELRAKPGAWALIYEGTSRGLATGMATQIRRGYIKTFAPAGTFDAAPRAMGGGVHRVYAVYLGKAGIQ